MTPAEPNLQRARRLQEAHERMIKDARIMVRLLGAHDTAGVLLGAIRVVLIDALGRKRARALLREVVDQFDEHDGPPPGAERN